MADPTTPLDAFILAGGQSRRMGRDKARIDFGGATFLETIAETVRPLVASVSLGVARAAIADLTELAQAKTPSYSQVGLADRPVVQDKLARARAAVDAARSYLYGALAAAEEAVETQTKLSIEQGIPLALAASHAIEAAIQAVDLVHSCAGTSGIRNELRFQQYFRDVHTMSQHAFASPARFESVGKLMLGRESDWPFYYL